MRKPRPGEPEEARSHLAGDGTSEGAGAGRPSLLALGIVVFLATVPFLNSFSNSFVFDDRSAIEKNPRIKTLENLPVLLETGYWAQNPTGGGLYRPLVTTSYAVNHALGGLNPFGYHLVNLLAHLGVCLLLYRLALRLFRHWEAALLAAALFAVHPLNTEAVTGIAGRADLFAAAFFLLSWEWFLKSEGHPGYRAASLGAFALSLLSKENAASLPAVLILSDLYEARGRRERPQSGRGFRGRATTFLRRYLGYGAVLAGYLLVRMAVLGRLTIPPPAFLDNPLAQASMMPRFLTALKVAGQYLWLMVWPLHLSPDYSYNQIPIVDSFAVPGVLLAALAWGALIGLACWSCRGTRRAFLCVGFTLITFLPVSNFLIPIGTIMGERLFYLPSAGLCFLVSVGWLELRERGRGMPARRWLQWAILGSLAAVILLFAVRTIDRNRDWRDQATLFRRAAEVAPNSAKVRLNLAGAYAQKGLLDDAVREARASLAIFPIAMTHRNLGILYLHKGLPWEAVAEFRAAVTLDPHDSEAYNGLGYTLLNRGDVGKAISALRTAIELDPTSASAHYSLGRALAEESRWPEAIAAYREARRLNPEFWEASFAMGIALEEAGRPREAAEAYEDVLRLRPGLKAAHRRLGRLYQTALGEPEKAREHLQRAGEGQ